MLNENIKAIRKAKGLSQEELAVKISVVRQTVSKWEQGLSVPDSEMLLALSEALDTPVSVLLGETVTPAEAGEMAVICEKLELVNLQLAQRKEAKRRGWHWFFIALCAATVFVFALIVRIDGCDLTWDHSQPEVSVVKVLLHTFVWVYVRAAPLMFIGAMIGAVLTRRKA